MSNCTNCFNGCEIVSDRCVKYTGIDIPELEIQTGDTLSHVEQSLITYLISALNGTGIKPVINNNIICNAVSKYLPTCGDITIVDISVALIKATCDLKEQIDGVIIDVEEINAELAILNAQYTIPGCIEGTVDDESTHSVLQVLLTNFCALFDSLPTTYVSFNNIDQAIEAYINANGGANVIANRMVPYAVVPYFGPITGIFDSTGAGLDLTGTGGQDWRKVYLCNNNNGTPDMRGWGLVGAINGVPGGTLSPVVNPSSSPANPNYSLYDTAGANQITLSSAQIPPLTHTHGNTAVSTISPNPHTHTGTAAGPYVGDPIAGGGGFDGGDNDFRERPFTTASTSLAVATTVTINNTTLGEGLPHPNIQPVKACYFIQYRP
jgi:microcystin-dependent protein